MDDGQKMGTTYSTEKQNVSLAEQCVTNIQIYSNIFYRYWIFEYKYWINTKKLPYSIRMFNYSNNYTNFNHLFMKYSTILSYLLNIRFFSILVFVFDQKSNNICIRLWSHTVTEYLTDKQAKGDLSSGLKVFNFWRQTNRHNCCIICKKQES